MKQRISAVLMLSLMLSMLLLPLSASADTGKSIVKEMVQSPADYSVNNGNYFFTPYSFWELFGRAELGDERAYYRIMTYWPPDWVFLRLPEPVPQP